MATTNGLLVRTDDGSGKNVATRAYNDGSADVHAQVVTVADSTTPTQQLAIDSSGRVSVLSLTNALPAGTNAIGKLAANSGVDIGDVDVTSVPAPLSTTGGGTEATALRVTVATDSTGLLSVDDNGSSLTVDGTVTASNCTGNVAHSASDSGNPVKVGMKAIAYSSNPTAVDADERTDWYANRHGIPFVTGPHMAPFCKEVTVLDADGAQTDAAILTVGAGNKIAVTNVFYETSSANTVGVDIRVGFAAANLAAASATAVDGIVFAMLKVVPGSGGSRGGGMGVLGIGTDGQDLRYSCDDPVSGGLKLIVSGFTIES